MPRGIKRAPAVKAPEQQRNRVWIELEHPRNEAHGHQIAKLANAMLNRMAEPEDRTSRGFHWSEHEKRFCYGDGMGYLVCTDWGHWFNLDYLGRA